MEKASKKILGLPVFSIKEGQKLGQVKELVIDHDNKSISGLIIQSKGIFREDRVIPYGKIKNIGQEAIIVETHTSLERKTNLPQIVEAINNPIEIIGTKILTEGGISLGRVCEYYFQSETGEISNLEIGGNLVEGFFKGQTFLPISEVVIIGKDAIITKDNAEDTLSVSDRKIGNPLSTLNHLKSSTGKTITDTSKHFQWLKDKKQQPEEENISITSVFPEEQGKSTSNIEMDLETLSDNTENTTIEDDSTIEKPLKAKVNVNIKE